MPAQATFRRTVGAVATLGRQAARGGPFAAMAVG